MIRCFTYWHVVACRRSIGLVIPATIHHFLLLTLTRGTSLIFSRFTLIKGPKRVLAILLMFQKTRFNSFERYNWPASRAAKVNRSS